MVMDFKNKSSVVYSVALAVFGNRAMKVELVDLSLPTSIGSGIRTTGGPDSPQTSHDRASGKLERKANRKQSKSPCHGRYAKRIPLLI